MRVQVPAPEAVHRRLCGERVAATLCPTSNPPVTRSSSPLQHDASRPRTARARKCEPPRQPQAVPSPGFSSHLQDTATYLERNGYTTFTPHYITLQCPQEYLDSDFCQSQCINRGRYCEQDPDGNLTAGFTGKDVVEQNLRQLCVFEWGKANNKPWVWWNYVTENGRRCSMGAGQYSRGCLMTVERDQQIDTAAIDRCVGNPSSDAVNPLLDAERAGLVRLSSSSCFVHYPD